MHVWEMRMLRWIYRNTRSNKNRNEVIKVKVRMTSKVDKMKKQD